MLRFSAIELMNAGPDKLPYSIRRRLRRLGLIEDIGGGLHLTEQGRDLLDELARGRAHAIYPLRRALKRPLWPQRRRLAQPDPQVDLCVRLSRSPLETQPVKPRRHFSSMKFSFFSLATIFSTSDLSIPVILESFVML